MRAAALVLAFALMPVPPPAAAGSLRAALDEAAAPGGATLAATYGAAGLLRARISGGELFEAFASANMEHPRAVGRELGRPAVLFARDRLCAVARPGLDVSPDTLLDRMLDPAVKLGTSTPPADPAGDYAFAAFARAEAAKALTLTGGPASDPPPPGRDTYAWQFERGAADLFLTY